MRTSKKAPSRLDAENSGTPRKIGNNMNTWKHFIRTCQATVVCVVLAAVADGQTTSRLSSSFLARGEQSLLEVSVIGGRLDAVPEIPATPALKILDTGAGPMTQMMRGRMSRGRQLETTYQFIVSSYDLGRHVIPPIKVMVDHQETFTEPLEVEVFDPDELTWSEVVFSGRTIRYASAFRSLNSRPYENETTPVEIKLYMPMELVIEDWGIPDFQREGLVSWRFQPAPMRSQVNLLGQPYSSIAYPSTITPTRSGKVSIGPAKIRLMTRTVVQDPFPRQVNEELHVAVPKLELDAKPLPEGAPQGFENAVGNFRIAASATTTEIQEGDPITVDLTVSGSGTLDTLNPPQLASTDGWKVYGSTSEQRDDERRQLSGSVVFHQSLRPLEIKSEIPAFRLVYFDPTESLYKTVLTDPIPLQMRPSTVSPAIASAAVQSLPIPVERMTDILALVTPAQLTLPAHFAIPPWAGHAVGGLLALMLLIKAFWLRYAPRLRKNPLLEIRAREIREIANTHGSETGSFLKAAGAFIERRLGNDHSPEIQAILAERDAVCFRADTAKIPLNRKRRDEILRALRKAALVCALVVSVAAGITPARADDTIAQAQAAYDAAKYDEAIQLWFDAGSYDQLTADTLYNIGNACYRSGSPGQAALYYRRALTRDSSHQEALQNLRFIERKYGAITVQRPDYQYALSRLPLAGWQAIFWVGGWLILLGLLVFPATRRAARIRIAGVAALVIGPLLLSAGALGWRYFPNDSQFAPVARQAVITGEKVTLHTDAARTSPEVIDAPPGSLCEILRESGRWAYVAFATKTRGWVPVESIERILPDKPPELPKFPKPKAGGKTA
jgi:tetratricopeptide (TPR) repeat protein